MGYIVIEKINFSVPAEVVQTAKIEYKKITDPPTGTIQLWDADAIVLTTGYFSPQVVITGLDDLTWYEVYITLACGGTYVTEQYYTLGTPPMLGTTTTTLPCNVITSIEGEGISDITVTTSTTSVPVTTTTTTATPVLTTTTTPAVVTTTTTSAVVTTTTTDPAVTTTTTVPVITTTTTEAPVVTTTTTEAVVITTTTIAEVGTTTTTAAPVTTTTTAAVITTTTTAAAACPSMTDFTATPFSGDPEEFEP